MERRAFLLAATAATAGPLLAPRTASAQAAQITGAGATFPRPVYERWGQAAREAAGIQLNYQSIGSGGGIPAAAVISLVVLVVLTAVLFAATRRVRSRANRAR